MKKLKIVVSMPHILINLQGRPVDRLNLSLSFLFSASLTFTSGCSGDATMGENPICTHFRETMPFLAPGRRFEHWKIKPVNYAFII
jgi:hypothetical protein